MEPNKKFNELIKKVDNINLRSFDELTLREMYEDINNKQNGLLKSLEASSTQIEILTKEHLKIKKDELQNVDADGVAENIDVTTAFTGKDLTTSGEIQLSTSDTSIATEDIGKGVVIGHPIHLDVTSLGTDVTIPEQDWDGGEW